eukprot:XP_002589975.1 hypothetical protein BRAFLDRAFT_81610 [Branchiostoma floridae]
MDVFTVTGAIAALSAVFVVVYFMVSQRTSKTSSWPKTKQSLAYTRPVIPDTGRRYMLDSSLNNFIPVGGATTVHDVARFFAQHGNKFSIFSIDWEQEVVVFTRPVDGTDLKKHPFFCEAQKQSAAEVLCVPLEQLQDVANTVADKAAHVQEVFIFMTGRCGTTLVTRLAEATSVAQAVNEPYVFTDISMGIHRLKRSSQRGHTQNCPTMLSNEETTVTFLRNVVTLLNHSLVTSDPGRRDVIFYKLQPSAIMMADLIARTFPTAKTVFMYRNGLEFSESMTRIFFQKYMVYVAIWSMECLRLWNLSGELPDYIRCFGDDPKFSTLRHRGSLMFYIDTWWASVMQHAANLQSKQPAYFFHAIIYYSALLNDKEKTFGLLMRKLGLKWNPENKGEDTNKMKKAFVEDSQAGTTLSGK